jgi:hypothetical protein
MIQKNKAANRIGELRRDVAYICMGTYKGPVEIGKFGRESGLRTEFELTRFFLLCA